AAEVNSLREVELDTAEWAEVGHEPIAGYGQVDVRGHAGRDPIAPAQSSPKARQFVRQPGDHVQRIPQHRGTGAGEGLRTVDDKRNWVPGEIDFPPAGKSISLDPRSVDCVVGKQRGCADGFPIVVTMIDDFDRRHRRTNELLDRLGRVDWTGG